VGPRAVLDAVLLSLKNTGTPYYEMLHVTRGTELITSYNFI